MNRKEKLSALIAGLSLIIMAVAAAFAFGYVHQNLVVESAGETYTNLLENRALFKAGIAAWIVIFVTDLLVSFSLYVFFKRGNKTISFVTAFLRVVYTLILGVAIYQLIAVDQGLRSIQEASDIYVYLLNFHNIWSAGLIVFGFHLIGLAYLASVSPGMPRIFSYLLYLACMAYIFIHGSRQMDLFGEAFLIHAETILSLPMAFGELILAIWLIFKGLRK